MKPNSNVEVPTGLPMDWIGPFETFCARMGISRVLSKALLKSLSKDEEFIAISQRQRFVSAETAWRHLRILQTGEQSWRRNERPRARKGIGRRLAKPIDSADGS